MAMLDDGLRRTQTSRMTEANDSSLDIAAAYCKVDKQILAAAKSRAGE